MTRYVKFTLFITIVLFSCEEEKIPQVEETFEDLAEAKAFYPGLGYSNDTILTIFRVFDPIDSTVRKSFIHEDHRPIEIVVDSLKRKEVYSKDCVEFQMVKANPIPAYSENITLFLQGGLKKEKVKFYNNEKPLKFEHSSAKLFDYYKVLKQECDSIGVAINDSKPVYSNLQRKYNYVRVFIKSDSIVQFNYMYFWEEL